MLLALVAGGQIAGDQPGVQLNAAQRIADLVGNAAQHEAQLGVAGDQFAPHLLHRFAQIADFVVGRGDHLLVHVAPADFARGLDQLLDGPRQRPRQPPCHPDGEQRTQSGKDQHRPPEDADGIHKPGPDFDSDGCDHLVAVKDRGVARHVRDIAVVKKHRMRGMALPNSLQLPAVEEQIGVLAANGHQAIRVEQRAVLAIKNKDVPGTDPLFGAFQFTH